MWGTRVLTILGTRRLWTEALDRWSTLKDARHLRARYNIIKIFGAPPFNTWTTEVSTFALKSLRGEFKSSRGYGHVALWMTSAKAFAKLTVCTNSRDQLCAYKPSELVARSM